MKVSMEKTEDKKVVLHITVPKEEFEKSVQKAYLKNRGQIQVNGFRKGKAPRKIIEKLYGAGVFFQDALEISLPAAYDEAVKETGIEPVDRPEWDIEELEVGQDLVAKATVTVKPEIDVPDYKGITIDKVEYTVSDEDVDEAIKKVQKSNCRWVEVEDAIQAEDRVKFDYKGTMDGEEFAGGSATDHTLEIGSNQFIPGFEDKMIGLTISEEPVSIDLTFPEDYHADDLKGKDVVFELTIKNIERPELPEMTDEFVSEISEFEKAEEYIADTKAKMEEEAEKKQRMETENKIMEVLIKNTEIDVPECMINYQIDTIINDMARRMQMQGMSMEMYMQYTGMTIDNMREQYKEQAENQVRGSLIMEKIMEAENIEVDDAEKEKETQKMAKEMKMEMEKFVEVYGAQIEPMLIDNAKQRLMFDKIISELKFA